MKKFMFSAVALVAFSFAGMASTEVKEEKIESIESKEVFVGPCEDAGFEKFMDALDNGQTYAQANAIYADYVNKCKKASKTLTTAE